jgi:hypothetical protein
LIAGAALGSTVAPPAEGPEGDWQGSLDTGSGTLRIVLHIKKGDDGTLTGTLDSVDQGAKDIKLTAVSYKDEVFHFEIQNLGASYDGKMNKKSTEIAGEWKQQGASLALTFKRVSK